AQRGPALDNPPEEVSHRQRHLTTAVRCRCRALGQPRSGNGSTPRVINYMSNHHQFGRDLTRNLLASLVLLSVPLASLPPILSTQAIAHVTAAPTAGPFVTLLFSRSEITASDNCVETDNGIARLDMAVAPYLRSRGMSGTGTLVTDATQATARRCTHYGD